MTIRWKKVHGCHGSRFTHVAYESLGMTQGADVARLYTTNDGRGNVVWHVQSEWPDVLPPELVEGTGYGTAKAAMAAVERAL